MITLQLGICNDDHVTVHKTFTVSKEVHCDIYRQCNLHNPQFILEYDASIVDYNYAYVPEWNSYYFLGEPDVAPGGRMIISCRKDVLFSNAADIDELECNIVRQENLKNAYLSDSKMSNQDSITTNVLEFPMQPVAGSIGGRCYVMTVIGGYVLHKNEG